MSSINNVRQLTEIEESSSLIQSSTQVLQLKDNLFHNYCGLLTVSSLKTGPYANITCFKFHCVRLSFREIS